MKTDLLALHGGTLAVETSRPLDIWPPEARQDELEEIANQRNQDIAIKERSETPMTRIEFLHRGPLREKQFSLGIDSIYQYNDLLSIDDIPITGPDEHTMFEAIDKYVMQKLPVEDLLATIRLGGSIEVHGIYPKHFQTVLKNGFDSGEIEEVQFYHRPTTRKYNVVRPRFFKMRSKRKFMICVAPGSDYIKHYGTMIRHLITKQHLSGDLFLKYYPMAFHSLPFWTHLYGGFVSDGDRVIIGYVDELFSEISGAINLKPISSASNPYLESRRMQLPSGGIVNFLGVNFSFWGNLSQIIAESLCRSGAKEIIYAGKLGSMTHPDSLYRDLFIPSQYFTLNHKNVVNSVSNLRNGLLEMYPQLNSGVHVSVPTVLEEDYVQRQVTESLQASSIDNEISQIAHAVANHNMINGRNVSFSAFHFATDYVRKLSEVTLNTNHDLARNRSDSALKNKDRAIKNCAKHIIPYLENT